MKVKLILAEAATSHPDGTVSILRAGITHLWGKKGEAVPFQGCLVVRIDTDAGDEGRHDFDLRCMDLDGKPSGPALAGSFDSPVRGGAIQLLLQIAAQFSHGSHAFHFRVNKDLKDTWALNVGERPQPPGQVKA